MRIDDPTCPHCGAAVTIVQRHRVTAVAVLGLALTSGCANKDETGDELGATTTTTIDEPDSDAAYGLPDTYDSEPDTGPDVTDDSADSGSSSGGSSESESSDTGSDSTDGSTDDTSGTSGGTDTGASESGESESGSSG